MSRRVYLHIGAPKTGTTYLQDRLTLNAASLADHGVHFPSRSPLVSPGLFHFRAALDLLGQDWGGEPGHAAGNWDALAKRVRRKSGTVIVSHEILAPARAEHVARAMADLDGSEVHVVYSARDLGRAIPAAWQESIKQGRKWSYRKFLRKTRRGKPWFFRAFDLPTVLATWGSELPPERIHVVTVPHRPDPMRVEPEASTAPGPVEAIPGDPLWLRFCEVFGIDPAWAPRDSDRTNQSLGVAETTLLRQLNRRLDRTTRREASYDALIRRDARPGRADGPDLGTRPAAARPTTTGPRRWPSAGSTTCSRAGSTSSVTTATSGRCGPRRTRTGTTPTGCHRASDCRSPSTRWRP